MRFELVFKTPDALERAIEYEAENLVGGPPDSEEHDILWRDEVRRAKKICEK